MDPEDEKGDERDVEAKQVPVRERRRGTADRRRSQHALPESAGQLVVPSGGPGAGHGRSTPANGEMSLAARQERALALLCQGMRPAAIAEALGTTPATVRRWLRRRFEGIAHEAREEYAAALLRAIESQREISRAAWDAYSHEREVEAALLRGDLDYVRRRAVRRGDAGGSTGGRHSRNDRASREAVNAEPDEAAPAEPGGEELLLEEYERPRHSSQGARYLSVALVAQREMARLQGLYDEIAQQPAQISITITRRPDGPENIPPGGHPMLGAPSDDEDGDDEEDDQPQSEDAP